MRENSRGTGGPHRSARVAVAAVVAGFLAIPIAPSGVAQGSQQDFWNSTDRTFYLHLAQYCDRKVSLIRWIDEFDWPNDLDGCGGDVLDPTTRTWTDVFPAFVPLYANVTTAATAEMHIFVLSRAVDQTTVDATLDLGYATCGGRNGPAVLVQEKVGGFHEFVIECTFEVTGEPDPVAKANLTVTVSATYTYGYGTEESHASHFILHGLTPAPPTEEVEFFEEGERPLIQFEEEEVNLTALPKAQPGGGAPGAGAAASLGSIAILVAVASRWRRLD